jgi:hypothetical protein
VDSAIRQKALRSAAKVAFGASVCWGAALSGCGGKSVYGDDESTENVELSGGTGALATGGATGSSATGGSATAGGSGPSGGSAEVGGATAGGSGPTGGSAEVGGAGAGPLDAGRLPELACTQPIGLDGSETVDEGVFSCCAGYVEQVAPQGSAIDAPRLAADPSLVNCCRYVTSRYYDYYLLKQDAGATVEYPYAAHDACCYPGVLGETERDESFCTPWGPPVPPALESELEVA